MSTTTYQRAMRRQVAELGNDAAARQMTGMDGQTLHGHLRIASSLLAGDKTLLKSRNVRAWLHAQAQRSGYDPHQVDAVIKEVLAAPDGESAARRYAQAIGGDARAAEQGLSLARTYLNESAIHTAEHRLRQADKARDFDSFKFQDDERMQQAREESTAVRDAIQRAAISSGAMAPPPRTLREAQIRAAAHGEAVADAVEAAEARRRSGQAPSLRDEIAMQAEIADALAHKHDVGIGADQGIGDVIERADTDAAVANDMLSHNG